MSLGKVLGNVVFGVAVVATAGIGWVLATRDGEDGIPFLSDEPAIEPHDAPNIIFITVDTLRADRLGSYGYDAAKTPVLDALAREGIVFENATVPLPRTTPALASLMTGLWSHHHGAREVWEKVEHGTFLADVLESQGYYGVAVSANSAAGPNQGFDKGFDAFAGPGKLRSNNARAVTDEILEFAKAAPDDEPLFLWAHYVDPHWPYHPPKHWKDQPKAPTCRELERKVKKGEIKQGSRLANHDGVSAAALDDCRALYDAEVAYTDHEIGRLIEELKTMDEWKNSIIVFTADHGEGFGEDGLWFGHGPSLHDSDIRVPLFLVGPKVPKGRRDDGVAPITSVYPTILEMIGLPREEWPDDLDSSSLAWRWDGNATTPERALEVAFAEAASALKRENDNFLVSGRAGEIHCVHDERYSACKTSGEELVEYFDRDTDRALTKAIETVPEQAEQRLRVGLEKWKPEGARARAVRSRDFKLVERPQIDGTYARVLYNLKTDPEERVDVSEKFPEVLEEMGALLERWLADAPLYEGRERSAEQLEKLRSLGYIQ